MAGGLLSTLRLGFLAGGVAFVFSPYFLETFRPSPAVLRFVLNVSWGTLFGAHFWFLFLSKRGIPGVTDAYKFHFLTILSSGLLLFSISGLAPTNYKFRASAYTALGVSTLGLGLKWLEDTKEPKALRTLLFLKALSKSCQLTTFLATTLIAFS